MLKDAENFFRVNSNLWCVYGLTYFFVPRYSQISLITAVLFIPLLPTKMPERNGLIVVERRKDAAREFINSLRLYPRPLVSQLLPFPLLKITLKIIYVPNTFSGGLAYKTKTNIVKIRKKFIIFV